MIVLDTNQLERHSIDSYFISLLKLLAKSTNNTLALTEVAYNEHCAHFQYRLRQAYSQKSKASAELEDLIKAAGLDKKYSHVRRNAFDREVERGLSAYQVKLREIFTLIDLDGASAIEALRREARRVSPASTSFDAKGNGARDAAIWLSVIKESVRLNEVIYLVSADKAAFKAEQCTVDAENAGASIVVLNDIAELLNTLSDSTESEVELSPIENSIWVQENIWRYIQDILWEINRVAIDTGPGSTRWEYGDSFDMQFLKSSDTHGHVVGGNKWVTGRVRWLVRYPVRIEQLKQSSGYAPPGVDNVQSWTVSFQIVTSLLFHGSTETEDVEVLSMGRPSQIVGQLESVTQPG